MLKRMLFGLLLSGSVDAETRPPDRGCRFTDRVTIADAGVGRAIVTYYNNVNSCSRPMDRVFRSAAGIEVRVIITIGGRKDELKERIKLEPLDPQMMSIPPEGWLFDGETQRFIIQGGLG